jgi:hypothetical protein
MPRDLPVPPDLGPAKAVDWFRTWAEAADEDELRCVLPEGTRLRPTGLVLLAAGLAARKRSSKATSLAGDPDARQRIEGLRAITDLRTARELADEASSRLEETLDGVAPSPVRMARFVFEELGANVVQHSEASETGFGVLQANASERSIELAFADSGIGFYASLAKNPELEGRITDEAEALQLALGKGLTGSSSPRRNMGMGLGLLQDFADRLGGELWIASGDALLRRRTTAGVRASTVHSIARWQGSWICLEARLG